MTDANFRRMCWLTAVALSGIQALAAPVGDPAAGRALLKDQQCLTCHRVAGEGGMSAPSLGWLGGRSYTPASMAAQMWNHAPAMWAAMDAANLDKPSISTEKAADLFAYFYMARFFETRADVGRGRRLFTEKGCAECHGGAGKNAGPALSRWGAVGDPIELARQMWNHAPKMTAAAAAGGKRIPQLTATDMNDIASYAASQSRGAAAPAAVASGSGGAQLFETKGCAGCHTGANALPRKGVMLTTADLAASMWNHSGRMKPTAELQPDEMRQILAYVWSRQFEQEGGDAARGAKVWAAKGCQGCHAGGAPAGAGGADASSYRMVAVLWRHGPDMLKQMKAKGVAWPQFAGSEMSDLIAYVRTAK